MFKNLINWIDARIPMTRVVEMHMTKYPALGSFLKRVTRPFLLIFITLQCLETQ